MTPQQAADAVAEIIIVAREAGGRSGAFGVLVLRALKQATTRRGTSATRAWQAPLLPFTSPIRRYPDVVAHRALLQGLGIDEAATPPTSSRRPGVISSSAEREAMQIERDADDVAYPSCSSAYCRADPQSRRASTARSSA